MMDKMRATTDTSVRTIYFVSEGNTLDQALFNFDKVSDKLQDITRSNPSIITKVNGIGCFLPAKQTQQERIARWNAFWEEHRKD